MSVFIVKVMLQEVKNEEVYQELDLAMSDEEGYPYVTSEDEKIFALPPDTYEFDLDINATVLLNIVTLICSKIEKKYNLKKSPILVVEAQNIQFAHLEELDESDFEDAE